MKNGDYKLIREIESSILDKEHKKFDVLKISSEITIPYFLKAYGDAKRDSVQFSDYSVFTHYRILHQLILAISQSIKWVSSSEPDGNYEYNSEDYEKMSFECSELIKWSFEYIAIAQYFTAWSRELTEITINQEEKEIHFVPPSKEIAYSYYLQQESNDDYVQNTLDDLLENDLFNQTYSRWANEYKINSPPIAKYINWERAIKSNLFPIVYERMEQLILPEINKTADLGGYTLDEFRIFHSTLFINFYFIDSYEQWLDKYQPKIAIHFGSNPITFKEKEMISFLSKATSISKKSVGHILTDLSLDLNNFHSNLLTQPIVRSINDEYSILPNLYAFLNPSRLISGALTKSIKKRKIYDRLINQIERSNINRLNSFLIDKTGFDIYCQSFRSDKNTISPDFVLINKSNNEILIADYKHFLVPLNALEIAYKQAEINKGIDQILKYESFFINNPELVLKLGLRDEFSISKMMITRLPTPIPLISDNVKILDLETFKKIIDNVSLFKEIEQEIERNAKRNFDEEDLELIEITTEVNDWKFIRHVYAAK